MTKHPVVNRRQVLGIVTGATAAVLAPPRFSIAQGATIKIGNQADMTGFLSVYGYAFDIGAKAAVKYINDHGGIAGRKVEYFLEDTESDVPTGVRKFRKLVESDKCDFVLGATHSGINLATNPVAKELKTLHFAQGEASQTTGEKANRYVVRIRQHSRIQGLAAVDFAIDKLGKNWTFMITDYSYGQAFINDLAPMVEARGGKVLAKIAVPVNTPDMIPYLAGVRRDTNVLFSVFAGPDAIRYMQGTYQLGLSKTMARLAPWGMIDATSLKGIEQPLEGAHFLSHSQRYLDQVPARLRPFVTEARELIGVNDDCSLKSDPNRLVASSYYLCSWEVIFMLKQAIETSGWTSKANNEKLVHALEGFQAKESLNFPMGDFEVRPQDHQGFENLWIEQVQNGKLVTVAEVSREKTQFPPVVDLTKEAI
jgi:branched-chain amino acid transport system substrate-binding protein